MSATDDGASPLARAIAGRSVIVLAGAGGVGKTTISAAIAVALARRGERVCVITIDPARRLADALGVHLGSDPTPVPLEGAAGSLDALMLDVKATFDRLIAMQATSDDQRDAILRNRIYRSLSGSVAGAQEYMAMEQLHELVSTGRYDRIVLDTPPTRDALDFLDAPVRLIRFIEGRSLRMFLRPSVRAGRMGIRVAGRGAGLAFAALERITGVALLREMSDFFLAFEGMIDGFHDRAEDVQTLLASSEATFLIVTSPLAEPVAEAAFFAQGLAERGMPRGGIVANRVHPSPLGDAGAGLRAVLEHARGVLAEESADSGLADRAVAALADAELLARADREQLRELAVATGVDPVAIVPLAARDIADADALDELAAPLGLA
jgi:anion-transporting  ArsA/GET3 family ATPase